MKPGPTGQYFRSKPLMPGDRGGWYAAFRVFKEERIAAINFGTRLSWIASDAGDTLSQARMFQEEIQRVFGALSYDPSTLPIRVVPNVGKQIVESHFPKEIQVLAANPEVFLAWAEKLEEAVTVIRTAN